MAKNYKVSNLITKPSKHLFSVKYNLNCYFFKDNQVFLLEVLFI